MLSGEIGRGSFANVYRGQDQQTGRPVAIKAVVRSRLKNQKLIDNLEIEINILKTMRHAHIVALLDCIKHQDHIYLVMEYCSLGDLSYFIRKRDLLHKTHPIIRSCLDRYPSPAGSQGLNGTLVVNFIKQLAAALEFLRQENLVHRDIKPQNLLLLPPVHSKEEFIKKGYAGYWELPILKIADFGFARFLPSTSMAETLCGSPLYMAPEILRYEKYNAKADLWSVGTVIYEMTVGKPPFRAANHVDLLRKIERAKDEISFPPNLEIDERLIRLICSLLKANPMERMGFMEFFNDPLVVNDESGISDKPLDCDIDDDQMFISEYLQRQEFQQQQQPQPQHSQPQQLQPVATAPSISMKKEISIPERVQEQDEESAESNGSADLDDQNSGHYTNDKNNSHNTNTQASVSSQGSSSNKVEELLNAHKQHQNQQKAKVPQLEREYVVVDKGTVEINALADDISQGRSMPKQIPQRYPSVSLSRGYSFSSGRRKSSVGTNGSSGNGSVGSGLREMLDYTHEKIFGQAQQQQQQQPLQQQPPHNSSSNSSATTPELHRNTSVTIFNKLINAKPLKTSANMDIISKLEMLATMAHSISIFAEVKFKQLIPMPPSLMNDPFGTATSGIIESVKFNDNLPQDQILVIGKEGLSLYVKVLSLLAEAMKMAGEWWKSNPLASTTSGNGELNELVQWIRNRFNESFEKAEFIRLKMAELDSNLVLGNDTELANKLIFDRALEMSKKAAMNELKGEELALCERSYATSVWMLESLLHGGLDSEDDRHTVQTFVDSIGNRLLVLRAKLG